MSSSNQSLAAEGGEMKGKFLEEKDQVRVKRKTLQAVLEQCQRALELLNKAEAGIDDNDDDEEDGYDKDVDRRGEVSGGGLQSDQEADELCYLLKSRVQCSEFLEKLECAQVAVPEDIAMEKIIFLLGRRIVEGVACFMAAYLLSLKQTKDLTPNQLQEGEFVCIHVIFHSKRIQCKRLKQKLNHTEQDLLCKKEKGKASKSMGWKVIYNVASWGATAVGIYQNPLLYQAASKAFWTSCNVLSKLI
ncbi:RNF214 protein [Hibiscus syriacus]|uniref:RNF214 protein n=1 Tax=Hibiscus syriacus TaxID=106335 RepID=A0A6A2W9A3_HIBSY|nr:RNF214 protein [Hibiscus syriacus]